LCAAAAALAAAVGRELARPPLLGCALAAAVGLGPRALREGLFPPPGASSAGGGGASLLAVAADAVRAFAGATVPVLMLLLGATLAGVATAASSSSSSFEPGGAGATAAAAPPLPARVVACVVAARLVVLPLLGLAFVLACYRLGLFPSPPPDGAFVVVLVLTHAVPTALNVHALAVLLCGARAQAAMARLVLAQYLACVLTLPPALAVALAAARRLLAPGGAPGAAAHSG
jgi:predicted permease